MSFYSRFPLGSDSDIRLLVLHPASRPEDAVVCDLAVASLGTKSFTALSYTWGAPFEGAPTQARSITLCHSSFTITENLFQALRHLRDTEISLLLWVDAICIDQNNNDERNHQVGLMAEIYRSAHQVYAWLGVDSAINDEAITFKFLELIASIQFYRRNSSAEQTPSVLPLPDDYVSLNTKERIEQAHAVDTPDLSHLFPEMNNPKHDLGACLERKLSASPILSFPPSDHNGLMRQAFETFGRRNYFFRKWVIQELLLARKATFFCANSRIEWSIIKDARNCLAYSSYWAPGKFHPKVETLLRDLHLEYLFPKTSLLGAIITTNPDTIRQDYVNGPLDTVQLCAWADCQDPRDRVYSLMSLFRGLSLYPDYSLSADTVYTQFARAVVNGGAVVRLFGILLKAFLNKAYCDHVAKKMHSLPSWVPDWDFPKFHLTIHTIPHNAGTSLVESLEVTHDNVLLCRFRKCCKILEARKPHQPFSNPDASCRKVHPPFLHQEDPSNMCQFLRIGQPGQQSLDSLPQGLETDEMEPWVFGYELKIDDVICCIHSTRSWVRGRTKMDRYGAFVILRRFDPNSDAYRLVGACEQMTGTGFDRVAGSFEVKIG